MHGANADTGDRGTRPTPVYRATHDLAGTAEVTTTVAHALADCLGVDVTDATTSLYDSIDPDALNALFRSRGNEPVRTATTLSFHACTCQVTVRGDGVVLIEPPADSF